MQHFIRQNQRGTFSQEKTCRGRRLDDPKQKPVLDAPVFDILDFTSLYMVKFICKVVRK